MSLKDIEKRIFFLKIFIVLFTNGSTLLKIVFKKHSQTISCAQRINLFPFITLKLKSMRIEYTNVGMAVDKKFPRKFINRTFWLRDFGNAATV